jgi:hypothetical protein
MATPLLANDVPVNQRRVGVLKVEDTKHPATRMLGKTWPVAEEFYTRSPRPWNEKNPEANLSSPETSKRRWVSRATRVHVLLSLDTERTNIEASPRARETSRRAATIPQSWTRTGARAACSTHAGPPVGNVDERCGVPRTPHGWIRWALAWIK